MIEHVGCPRCGIRRTTTLGTWGRFCFNCRAGIGNEERYVFQPAELQRLRHYRAAIRQGLYSDWVEQPRTGRAIH